MVDWVAVVVGRGSEVVDWVLVVGRVRLAGPAKTARAHPPGSSSCNVYCTPAGFALGGGRLGSGSGIAVADTFFSMTHQIADLALDFADVTDGRRKKVMSRPFGVGLLVGGISEGKPELWMTDPSGT